MMTPDDSGVGIFRRDDTLLQMTDLAVLIAEMFFYLIALNYKRGDLDALFFLKYRCVLSTMSAASIIFYWYNPAGRRPAGVFYTTG
jgi:hypothetical protein